MERELKLKKSLYLDRNKVFKRGENYRGERIGDRTVINRNAFLRDYKLGQAYANVRNLEFRSKEAVKLQSFREYLDKYQDLLGRKHIAEEKPRPEFTDDESYLNKRTKLHYPKGHMLVLVDKTVYNDVAGNINQYVMDIAREGYWASIYTIAGGTPAQIRNFIKSKKPVGAFLIGSIAAPWYEIDSDQFPCDLYYMDLNGKWSDPDGNGKFNSHSGDLDPEIWVGRLWTPTNNGNDSELINDYFQRNHAFRLGKLGHARSALAYVDDDWTGFDDCAFDELFPATNITKYTNPAVTDADLFKAEVNSLRSWVQLCAHSWVHGHSLRVEPNNEYINTAYFRDTNSPNAHFYNLFCCGPGKYTESDYLAGWYIFDQKTQGVNHGLAAIASAKSGSMLFFEDFYEPMGKGKTVGEAYVSWWKDRGPVHEDWEQYWFYGLTLLGDPTLTWWKGAVPQPEQPEKEDVFDHWPRKMQLRWDPVNLTGANYTVEVDAFGAVNAGQWAAQSGQHFAVYHNISTNTLDHNFVGMQRGRWRVRAKVDGVNCAWSPWSYFKFTI
jgi:hypothetical protein